MSTKITKDSGRSALEEFGRDSGIGDIPPEISQEEEILKGAISTFPNESERTIPEPESKNKKNVQFVLQTNMLMYPIIE